MAAITVIFLYDCIILYFYAEVSCFVLTEYELATPPLDGIILPGVTRQSILDLARKWVGSCPLG